MGLTDGTNNTGIIIVDTGVLSNRTTYYGTNVGYSATNQPDMKNGKSYGITTDSSKSGIIADTASLILSCNMIIKF